MGKEPLLVKKYGNRRLYDTDSSRYITLEELAGLIKEGRDVRVVDAKSGADLTKNVLLQIISDEERDRDLLPVTFLKQVIQMGDASMRESLQRYLSLGLEAFLEAQEQVEQRYRDFAGGFFNPMMWVPGMGKAAAKEAAPKERSGPTVEAMTEPEPPAAPEKEASAPTKRELEALKAQMAHMQAMLEKLQK